jgi:hypothetical protein
VRDLNEIPLTKLYQAQQMAQMRLQLWMTGQTHELMLAYGLQAKQIFLSNADDSGAVDALAAHKMQVALLNAWGDTFSTWVQLLNKARREAAALPFGVLAVFQNRLVEPAVVRLQPKRINEAVNYSGSVFNPQLRLLLDAAGEFIYGDGLNLSGRVWKLDRETRKSINDILMNGLSNSDSAWNLAQQFETYLGASQDCPRWTSTRLYKLSKADIAIGNQSGLLSGDACDGQGVAYKALRLARTEIQRDHALATDKQLAMSPWVQKEQVNLSPAHVDDDICNQTVADGEKGEGIYPVGTVSLPLHPLCMCFKTAVTMSDADFVNRMRGWLMGNETWTEMDTYAENIGGIGANLSADPSTLALAVWLWGAVDDIAGRMK